MLFLQEDLTTIFGCGLVTLVLSYFFHRLLPFIRSKIYETAKECNSHLGNSANVVHIL